MTTTEPGAKQTRERSTIGFPYDNLEAALEIARIAHELGGVSGETDQIAARMGQSPTSGAFRVKVSAARMFGLAGGSGQGVIVTQLGDQALDPRTAREALTDA